MTILFRRDEVLFTVRTAFKNLGKSGLEIVKPLDAVAAVDSRDAGMKQNQPHPGY